MLGTHRPTPDQPETTGIHYILRGVLYRRLDIVPNPCRSPHDPYFTFKAGNDWFSVYIVPERTSDTKVILRSNGSFPWNGKWNLRLSMPGDAFATYRPRYDQVQMAAEKIVDRVMEFICWREATREPVKLRLVVDNTKNEVS